MTFTELKNPTDWDVTFLQEATLWSRRSHDTQTQCGCVLVKDKTCISTGYNGFIRDIDDTILPTTRPDKYPFMIHAEANAVYNSARLGRSTLNSTAYITGAPCQSCLQLLYQCGIVKIIFSDISNPKISVMNDNYINILNLIKEKIELLYVPKSNINDSYLRQSIKEIRGPDV
jgi:dCMP deaminase